MSLAITRALRLAAAHPSIRVTDIRTEDAHVTAHLELTTELWAQWRVAGVSPSGVRTIEPVLLHLPADYPIGAPFVELRIDFNRAHPHINPGPLDRPPQPCLIQGSVQELIQTRGFDGYLQQLVDWLDKAATVTLNDPKHGWEPVRRDHIDDWVVVDQQVLRKLMDASGGCAVLPATYFLFKVGSEKQHFVDHSFGNRVEINDILHKHKPIGDHVRQGTACGLVTWAPNNQDGSPFVVDTYLPETVSTFAELLARADQYGCRTTLEPKLNHLALNWTGKGDDSIPVLITFLVRRPFKLVGTDSDIELCCYLLDLSSTKDVTQIDHAPIRLCSVRDCISPGILRVASGRKREEIIPAWALIGCGSVGSKIAVHLARQGRGPSLIVDNKLMSPHNYARHATFPAVLDHAPQPAKTTMLAMALRSLQQCPDVEQSDVTSLIKTADGSEKLSSSMLVLNTTASTVVRERLSFHPAEKRPRFGEAHLLGGGSAAYAAFEGSDGNPSLSDLAVESYRLIGDDDDLRDRVFNAQSEAITIGQGCSAVTFPMPDSHLSALAGGLAELTIRRLRDADTTHGQLALGKMGADGLSQSWTSYTVPKWVSIGSSGSPAIRISARVNEQIRKEIAQRSGTETGGILVGRFSQIGNCFQVVDLLSAPSDSIFTAEKFTLGTQGLKAAINALISNSGGSLYVIGTWHNHLVKSGPSSIDVATAAKLALRQFFPFLMLIALPHDYTYLVTEVVT
jgi:hypothetical protein